MNPIHELLEIILKTFPTAKVTHDPAEIEGDSSFLDIQLDDYWLNVEWEPNRGFYLTARNDVVFGEGADEVYLDVSEAVRRVLWLLEHKNRTAPPRADLPNGKVGEVSLGEIRSIGRDSSAPRKAPTA